MIGFGVIALCAKTKVHNERPPGLSEIWHFRQNTCPIAVCPSAFFHQTFILRIEALLRGYPFLKTRTPDPTNNGPAVAKKSCVDLGDVSNEVVPAEGVR